jgi:hypothetical protein
VVHEFELGGVQQRQDVVLGASEEIVNAEDVVTVVDEPFAEV